MNTRALLRLTFLPAAMLGLASLLGCSLGSVMIHERQSPLDFEATLETIDANAREHGWEVPRSFDFQQALTARGQPDPGRITVMKLCSPEFASRMFGSDESKYVSVMAPCSIAVYEKSDGRTYVSTMNMQLMSKLMGPDVGPVLGEIAAEDEAILAFTK